MTSDFRTKPWNSVKDMLPLLSLSYILQAARINANFALERKKFAYDPKTFLATDCMCAPDHGCDHLE